MTINQPHTLLTPDRLWTPGEAADAIEAKERGFRAEGIVAGQVVMFPAEAQAETVWALHALTRLGAVAMPVAAQTNPEQSLVLETAQAHPAQPGTALRLLTSGTTGDPKVVDLSLSQLEASAQASSTRLGHLGRDRWLCCLPLHHIGGLSVLLRTAFTGGVAELHPVFDPDAVNSSIHEGATMVSLVPTMLSRMLDARGDTPFPGHLRVILLGGAPASPSLIERCRRINAPVALTWGMTETASQVATRIPGDLRAAPDSGLPLPGISVTVEDGLLVVHGPIAPRGRYQTSDRGRVDDEGRIVVLGRSDDLIISGGENVAPLSVERILDAHPSVMEVAVVGRSDPQWGQRLVAFLVGKTDPELLAWAREHLAPHERPAEIHWVSELPRNVTGKVDRSALTDEAEIRHGFPETRRN
jgi:O-succinylbenzoic acid--CoA ligase